MLLKTNITHGLLLQFYCVCLVYVSMQKIFNIFPHFKCHLKPKCEIYITNESCQFTLHNIVC